MLVLSAVSLLGTTFCLAVGPVPLQVDACIVEVSASSLYGQDGVKKLQPFTILNVLRALAQGGGGKIVDTMRVVLIDGQEASYACNRERSESIVTNQQSVGENIESQIAESTTFQVQAEDLGNNAIALKFQFKQVIDERENIISENKNIDENIEEGADIVRQWSGATVFQAGKSFIAGIAQNDNKVIFLILTADIIK